MDVRWVVAVVALAAAAWTGLRVPVVPPPLDPPADLGSWNGVGLLGPLLLVSAPWLLGLPRPGRWAAALILAAVALCAGLAALAEPLVTATGGDADRLVRVLIAARPLPATLLLVALAAAVAAGRFRAGGRAAFVALVVPAAVLAVLVTSGWRPVMPVGDLATGARLRLDAEGLDRLTASALADPRTVDGLRVLGTLPVSAAGVDLGCLWVTLPGAGDWAGTAGLVRCRGGGPPPLDAAGTGAGGLFAHWEGGLESDPGRLPPPPGTGGRDIDASGALTANPVTGPWYFWQVDYSF